MTLAVIVYERRALGQTLWLGVISFPAQFASLRIAGQLIARDRRSVPKEKYSVFTMNGKTRSLDEMEAAAVDKAKASADAAFRPSPSVLNAGNPQVLMKQVDGPSLETYSDNESVYVGSSVPISAGKKLLLPINVSTPGSVVEYACELKQHDIMFSIVAEREEGITIVKVSVN